MGVESDPMLMFVIAARPSRQFFATVAVRKEKAHNRKARQGLAKSAKEASGQNQAEPRLGIIRRLILWRFAVSW
jgi:hypothetical protein